ncbi:MAG: FtsX-like permease family protein [bacterium]|nr:FtsX-like permease family protein [bacterium]
MNKNQINLPSIPKWILSKFDHSAIHEGYTGDVEEEFFIILNKEGISKARAWLWTQALKSIPGGISDMTNNNFAMFKNYVKIAFRNLKKNLGFSFINIFGLAIGAAVCMLIMQYVAFELSYDSFHENEDLIYRLRASGYLDGVLDDAGADCVAPAGKAVMEEFPEVVNYVKFKKTFSIFSYRDRKFRENRAFYATEALFNVFSFNLLYGDPSTVLSEINTVAISRSTAEKYFKDEDPIGKTLIQNLNSPLTVTGVFEDIPGNSHIHFDILVSYSTYASQNERNQNNWALVTFPTYVLLDRNTEPSRLEEKLHYFVAEKAKDVYVQYGYTIELSLQPVADIHLHSNYAREVEKNGDALAVYCLVLIAFIILLIAWVNYINLSTAKSVTRAKEVGIRKVVGAYRIQLIKQFLVEFFLINIMAIMISVLFVIFILPVFNQFTGIPLEFTLWSIPVFWFVMGALFTFGALLAGIYPAFILSSFNPGSILKGSKGSYKSRSLIKGMVVFQFASSVILIIGTITVYRQLVYMQEKDLGVEIEQTLVTRNSPANIDTSYTQHLARITTFKNELLNHSAISGVSSSSEVPGEIVYTTWMANQVNDESGWKKTYNILFVDDNYVDLYRHRLLAGRVFSEEHGDDFHSIIINETAMKQLGYTGPETAVGQEITLVNTARKIVGIISDYNQEVLKEDYKPIIFTRSNRMNRCSIRLHTENLGDTISFINAKWDECFPGSPFDYFFLDDSFAMLYDNDRKFGKIFGIFSLFAIVIACLGLFGLSSYTTIQRTKEIGVRKVLGASELSLLSILNKEFIILTLSGNLIAWPVAAYLMNNWLESFAFNVNLDWSSFIIAGTLTIFIALLTVSIQALRTARANPVDSLMYE